MLFLAYKNNVLQGVYNECPDDVVAEDTTVFRVESAEELRSQLSVNNLIAVYNKVFDKNVSSIHSKRETAEQVFPLLDKLVQPLPDKPAKTPKVKQPRKAPEKGDGIIANIKRILQSGKPCTKAEVVAQLKKKFPDRDEASMSNTVSANICAWRRQGENIKSVVREGTRQREFTWQV